MSTLKNIFLQATRPSRLKIMTKKALGRLERRNKITDLAWLEQNAVSFEEEVGCVAPGLWAESNHVAREIDRKARAKLAALPVTLGGGGATPCIYFLTRLLKPEVIVETGVAAGYSSQAFLQALDENGAGELFSSDFPYFRVADPEKYIGCLVDDGLKGRWHLLIEGDESNIPKIAAQVKSIDLVHYDSDKSYAGREFAMKHLMPLLSERGVLLMDDLHDNTFFRDFVSRQSRPWRVFRLGNKFVGMIGEVKADRLARPAP